MNEFVMDERYPIFKQGGSNILAILFIIIVSLFVYFTIFSLFHFQFFGENANYGIFEIILFPLILLIFLYQEYYWICGFNKISVHSDSKFIYFKNSIKKWRQNKYLIADIKNIELLSKIRQFKNGKETRYTIVMTLNNSKKDSLYISSDNKTEVDEYLAKLQEAIMV